MKLVVSWLQKNLHNQNHHSRLRLSTSLFSTQTPNHSSSSSSSSSNSSLFERVQLVRDPMASVIPVLQDWVSQGRPVHKDQLDWLVRTIKGFKRYHHALQISHWMTDSRFLKMSPSDAAVRLELIHRVHGLERAENYFTTLSSKLKTRKVYGALLHSYVRENRVHKAEATMEEMRNVGLADTSFPYNLLVNLYSKKGEYNKVGVLMQEMETAGIPQDKFTLRNLMSTYIASSDALGIETILGKMEEDACFRVDWTLYSMAASGYLKLGLIEKALHTLGKLEKEVKKVGAHKRKRVLSFLVTLYAGIGDRDEVSRVWNAYKPLNGHRDGLYATMIGSLIKLDDIEGAELIFEEWKLQCTIYDFRVVNCLLSGYCGKSLFDKAESVLEQAVAEGRTPYASSWTILASGYVDNDRLPKAIEMLKKGLLNGRKGWMPNRVVAACLEYLKQQGDITGIEEIISSLKNLDVLTPDTHERLLRACNGAGESFSEILGPTDVTGSTIDGKSNKLNSDGFSSDEEETYEILGG